MQAGHRGRTSEARAGLEALLRGSPGGTRLPGERELAQNLGVARMTLRAAMDDLVVAGRIARRPGSGTFVTHTSVAKDARLTSFSQDMAARGMTASSKVLAVDRRAASRAVALDLRIPVGDPVHRVHRLRLGDGDPIALETVWLPVAYGPTWSPPRWRDRCTRCSTGVSGSAPWPPPPRSPLSRPPLARRNCWASR